MYRHLFGIESYAIIQLVALILFAGLAVILMRRSNIRLRHAAALTVLYVLCNFLGSCPIRLAGGTAAFYASSSCAATFPLAWDRRDARWTT